MSKKASARYSKIFRRVWVDEKVRRLSAPKPNAQTLWFRLLSGPELTNIPGLIVAGAASLAEALGWSTEDLRSAFSEIEREGLAVADWSARLIWVPNAVRYNEPDNPNVIKSWATAWEELPECELKERARAALRAHVVTKGPSWVEAFDSTIDPASSGATMNPSGNGIGNPSGNPSGKGIGNPSGNRCRNQEQEQEQEQDLPPTPLAGGGEGPGPSNVRAEPTASSRPSPAERFLGSFEAEPDAKLQDEIARAFDRGWKSVTGRSLGIATRVKYHRERLGPLLEWARESDPNDPAGVVERAAKAFAESPDSSGEYAAMPFAKFCSQPGKYATKTSRDEEIERLTAEWIWFRDRAEDLYDWQERAAAREERDKRLEQLTKLRRGRAA